ncbi:MAG: S41 family peptidase [Chloroflexota bacterium]|nr:S41 family peptidase [Chloroflexota bacterium]
MNRKHIFISIFTTLLLSSLACQVLPSITPTEIPVPSPTSAPTPTMLPPQPVEPGAEHPNEPVFISGEIPFTSPFFLDTVSEAFVMLEDQGGFIQRDKEFEFPLRGQMIGPVELVNDEMLTYQLSLPAIPQGTLTDVDNDGEEDVGVQVFAVAYWSNTWGGPFLEERDGTGWSNAYASTVTDADRDYEITGGMLVVWAPDDEQSFPTGFGDDNKLFTADDPVSTIPAGYNLVDLDQEPFQISKEAQPHISLYEGDSAVNDFSEMSYTEAFDALFEKVSVEYPFTSDKNVDWQALYDEYAPRMVDAENDTEFFWALKDFTLAVSDAHIGISFNDLIAQVFYENYGGSFGLILVELSDGRVFVQDVLANTPSESAGIEVGAEITQWDGQPVGDAIGEVQPFFGPYSTEHHRRFEQLVFLTRVPPSIKIEIAFQNPDDTLQEITLKAEAEYDSLFEWLPSFKVDVLSPPIVGEVLEPSGLGYIRINTFSDDYNLTAQLWDHYIENLIDAGVPGLIIDVRVNGGGSMGLANAFVGYFFDEEVVVSQRSYYNEALGKFEYKEPPGRIEPGPTFFDVPIAVLVSPYCVSACEGFANSLTHGENTVIVGHFPTAGAYGEVGRGQYDLPADLSMQFPTGRSETPDGELLIEGMGVVPNITVPVTEQSALGEIDAVLDAAIEALLK